MTPTKLISNADRAMLHPYGVNGGRYGGQYQVQVTHTDGRVEHVDGMADNIEVPPGAVVRIVTTGGGGWGDPLAREPEAVAYDVQCGLVTRKSAKDDYGVVLRKTGLRYLVDETKTVSLRQQMRKDRKRLPMFDRGPYYRKVASTKGVDRPKGFKDPDKGWFAAGIKK